MRGHVQKKNGNWYVVLELDRGPDGKRRQKWISPRRVLGLNRRATKREAEQVLVDKLKEMQDGTYFEPSDVTVREFFKRWYDDYITLHLAPNTQYVHRNYIRKHIIPELGSIKLQDLRRAHVQDFCNSKLKAGFAPATVRVLHSIIHRALDYAVQLEMIKRNVAKGVSIPSDRNRKTLRTWDEQDVRKFLQGTKSDRLHALYLLALTTGMRQGELLGLRWRDVDFKHRTITIRQTMIRTRDGYRLKDSAKTANSRRTIDISPVVARALRDHRNKQKEEFLMLGIRPDNDLVFTNTAGNPFHPTFVHRTFAKAIERTGVPKIRFHDLRHTHATLLLSKGVNPKIISERLGHAHIGITLATYSHALPRIQKEAARKMDDLLT